MRLLGDNTAPHDQVKEMKKTHSTGNLPRIIRKSKPAKSKKSPARSKTKKRAHTPLNVTRRDPDVK